MRSRSGNGLNIISRQSLLRLSNEEAGNDGDSEEFDEPGTCSIIVEVVDKILFV